MLAEKLDLTHGAISQLERGLVGWTQPTLAALAKALECTPADLIGRNPGSTPDRDAQSGRARASYQAQEFLDGQPGLLNDRVQRGP